MAPIAASTAQAPQKNHSGPRRTSGSKGRSSAKALASLNLVGRSSAEFLKPSRVTLRKRIEGKRYRRRPHILIGPPAWGMSGVYEAWLMVYSLRVLRVQGSRHGVGKPFFYTNPTVNPFRAPPGEGRASQGLGRARASLLGASRE